MRMWIGCNGMTKGRNCLRAIASALRLPPVGCHSSPRPGGSPASCPISLITTCIKFNTWAMKACYRHAMLIMIVTVYVDLNRDLESRSFLSWANITSLALSSFRFDSVGRIPLLIVRHCALRACGSSSRCWNY